MRPSTPSGSRSASRPVTSLRSMRRLAPVLIFLVWVAPAQAKPNVSIQATPATGQAPLNVTLTATGDAVSYHWDLGDKTQADGPVVQHQYAAGRFTATVTASRRRRNDRAGLRRDHLGTTHLERPEADDLRPARDLQGPACPGAPRGPDHAVLGHHAAALDEGGQEGALRIQGQAGRSGDIRGALRRGRLECRCRPCPPRARRRAAASRNHRPAAEAPRQAQAQRVAGR